MKFTILFTSTIVSHVLSAPTVEKGIAARDKTNLNARRLPLPLLANALPSLLKYSQQERGPFWVLDQSYRLTLTGPTPFQNGARYGFYANQRARN
jgi:hypothetical protein